MKTPVLNYAVVVSGGIASGKSSALSIFRDCGFQCIDADEISHQILNQQADKVAHFWGDSYLNDDGTVNRSRLGQRIFSNLQDRKDLENLLHPLIQKEIYAQAKLLEQRKQLYFIDIPLFFENSNYSIANSLLIYAPREIQKERLMQRNQLNSQQAEKRLISQLDIEEKKQRATFVIDNSGNKEELEKHCKLFLQEIQNR